MVLAQSFTFWLYSYTRANTPIRKVEHTCKLNEKVWGNGGQVAGKSHLCWQCGMTGQGSRVGRLQTLAFVREWIVLCAGRTPGSSEGVFWWDVQLWALAAKKCRENLEGSKRTTKMITELEGLFLWGKIKRTKYVKLGYVMTKKGTWKLPRTVWRI